MTKAAERVASITAGAAAAAFGDPGGALQAGTTLAALAVRFASGGEAMQQAETLVQVGKQAKLRMERGRAALLKGDAEAAAAHAEAAAGFFALFAPLEGARLRDAEAKALWAHGRRFGGGGLAGAATPVTC